MFINPRKLVRSFKRAGLGLIKAVKEEQNFKIQLIFAFFVFGLAIFFQISFLKSAVLILSVSLLLVLELVNSVVERIIDILKPRVHHYAGIIKDLMSAAVLIVGINALIVAILIFWPYFFN